MRGGTVQINWHDQQPVLTLDFHPVSGRLATGGSDHDVKVCPFPGDGIILWKLHSTDDGEFWKVHKSFLFHHKDVLDLQWSQNGAFLVSASVDNSCIVWDANKGAVQQKLDGHLHYVQGVAWAPLGQYIASLSSDRTCRIYGNKPQGKSKNTGKMNFVCQHTLVKAEQQNYDESKLPAKAHLFHDETLPSFFRRLNLSIAIRYLGDENGLLSILKYEFNVSIVRCFYVWAICIPFWEFFATLFGKAIIKTHIQHCE
ncbi:hypothetical protein GUJ93_ZPchr0010g8634 [Zizania palustris]|uniref:CAF1B/HIR1 beta-propeller domain-containing protein n=1 Tax=Zizania palustris TaxID=103762 RepID=A0A8J5VVW0_ZIZPA|nr:hypothetical protein GUJ93_ZPchr0010g8634 [Zizania palustris]